MKVFAEDYAKYSVVCDCKYQKVFPYMNIDAVDVLCIRGVDIKGLAAYQYAPLCSDCEGEGCKQYEPRK